MINFKPNIHSVFRRNLLIILTVVALLPTACSDNIQEENVSDLNTSADIIEEIQPTAASTATLSPTPDPLIELVREIVTLTRQANESYIRGDLATWRETVNAALEYADEFDSLIAGSPGGSYDELGFASEEALQASIGNLLIAGGNEAYNNDQKVIALQSFNQAIELGAEQLSAAYSGRGHVFRFQGNTTDAISDFNQAIELDPKNADAYRGLAQLAYYSQGNLTAATEYIDKALSINPSFARVYFLRAAIAYGEFGDAASAETLYNQGLQYDPGDAEGYYLRAVMYDAIGRDAECIDDMNTAINMKPMVSWYYHQRGYCSLGLAQYVIALDDFETAISLGESDPALVGYAYGGIGSAYSNLGKYTEAIDAYSKAIEQHPENVNFYQWRGDVYRYAKDFSAAIDDYAYALSLDPSSEWTYFGLGLAHDGLDHYQDAYANYAVYLEREPADIPETRYACDRMNALHFYNAQNLLDMAFGTACNRFPSNSGGVTASGSGSTDSCPYGVIDGMCVQSLEDCPWGQTSAVGGDRCLKDSEAGFLQSINP